MRPSFSFDLISRVVSQPLFAGLGVLVLSAGLFAATPESGFPELQGWSKGETAVYGPGNLHQAIDGASDLFLKYNFEEMRSTSYLSKGRSFSVECYRHATPVDAFGIYSQGKPQADVYLSLGVEGYAEEGIVAFVAGRYYLELRTPDPDLELMNEMKSLARLLAGQLNEGAGIPALFSKFPEEGRVPHSEKFISKDVLGYAFLQSAYQVDYRAGQQAYSLFILPVPDAAEASRVLRVYCEEQKQPVPGAGYVEVKDRFLGPVGLLPTEGCLLLVKGETGGVSRRAVLEKLHALIIARSTTSAPKRT